MEKYFEFVSVKANQKEHRGFLTARKEWIKQRHEGGPDRKRLKSKKELLEARKQLEVTKQVGGRFTCPKKQFVSRPKKHGDLDQSKVVTENIMGQDVRGCQGPMTLKSTKTQLCRRRRLSMTAGKSPFAEIALARKRKAVMGQVAEGFHARDKVAVEDAGPEMSLDQLLALASNAQASEEGQGSKVEKEKEKDNASDSSSSSNTGSSEEEA